MIVVQMEPNCWITAALTRRTAKRPGRAVTLTRGRSVAHLFCLPSPTTVSFGLFQPFLVTLISSAARGFTVLRSKMSFDCRSVGEDFFFRRHGGATMKFPLVRGSQVRAVFGSKHAPFVCRADFCVVFGGTVFGGDQIIECYAERIIGTMTLLLRGDFRVLSQPPPKSNA